MHVDADPAVRVEVDCVAGEHFLLPLVTGKVKALGSKLKFKLVFFSIWENGFFMRRNPFIYVGAEARQLGAGVGVVPVLQFEKF